MAAYAAIVSLMNVLDNIQNHPRVLTFFYKKQIESLCQNLDFLIDFVESYNSHGGGIRKDEVEDLESHIVSAAQEAEDVIESHIIDQIHPGYGKTSPNFLLDLQKFTEKMDSIKENVMEVENKRGLEDQKSKPAMSAALARSLTTAKTTMVGFDSYLVQLLDWLTDGLQSDRRMIPITGMGGMGKTTLARTVYENSFIVQHFDVRAWVTVSQEYDVRKILSEIVFCLTNSISETETEHELGERLHKFLFGRRYLIILDDMWTIEVWNRIRFFFPQNDNTCRIVVTTRQLEVAKLCGSLALALDFLDDDRSWDLFCQKAFAEEGCPSELEEIGKKIVRKCRGLPLATVVIGGLLGKSSMMLVYWENVEKDLSSILNSVEDNQCLKILSLSYNHLPACLKPCFLYLGMYPEDQKICVSRLIKLWVAEGILRPNKPNTEQSLEDVAGDYIKDLVDRNLLLVDEFGLTGKVKTCSIHDLLRDFCIKVAEKEKFFFFVKNRKTSQDIDRARRLVIPVYDRITTMLVTSVARSVSGTGLYELYSYTLLRVMLDGSNIQCNALERINLRFLEDTYSCIYKLPSSISQLWNLQTLILTSQEIKAPSEIWEMTQLRHIDCSSILLPDPPQSDKQDTVMRNLHTLRNVQNFRCSEEVCKRMPNIRKLHIHFRESFQEISCYCHYNLVCLNKLESLQYDLRYLSDRDDLLTNLTFPSSLKKLTLKHTNLQWDDLTIIGSLPDLEALSLFFSVEGPEWNPIEGEFRRLKFLHIDFCKDLISWRADKSHFPVLEKLHLKALHNLEEIPADIGDIDTLGDICLQECSVSAAISAMKILEEQESLGNEDLRVRVHFWKKMEVDQFKMQVELEDLSFPRPNFQLSYNSI